MDDVATALRQWADAPPPVTLAEVGARVDRRRRGRRTPWVLAAAAVAVAALVAGVLAASGAGPGESVRVGPPPEAGLPPQVRVGGIPVLRGHTPGPGAPLHGGLVVPEGALLLGDVLPVRPLQGPEAAVEGRTWVAVLVVTGSLSGVVADLRAQAGAAGQVTATGGCQRFEDEQGEAGTGCGLTAWRPTAGGVDLLRADGTRLGGQSGPRSHVLVTWADGVAGPMPSSVPYGPPTGPEVEVPVPAPWPALPEVGERLVPRPVFPYPDEVALRVAPGTALVGPELADAGPPRFVLMAAGDPSTALAAYVDQVVAAQDGAATAEPVVTTEVEGRTVRRQLVHVDADGSFAATAVSRPGHPTYLLLERLHD